MNETEQKILDLITVSKKILIFSHIRPDWDAISSLLLAKELLEHNFPDKEIIVAQEKGEMLNAEYFKNYTSIVKTDASELIIEQNPDLLIIVDCPDFSRISFNLPAITETYQKLTIPSVGIDHHDRTDTLLPQYIYNHNMSSAAEEVYALFVKTFGFKETKEALLCFASGMLGDTNNFLFLKSSYRDTFENAAYLVEKGVNFAEIDRLQNMYAPHHLLLISEFLKNMTVREFYTYTYISDEFYNAHTEIARDRYSETKEIISLRFIRQVSNNKILFMMYPEDGNYKGSLRGIQDQYDMTVFGKHLNGGGHKSAVGYKLPKSESIIQAIEKTIEVITQYREEAKL